MLSLSLSPHLFLMLSLSLSLSPLRALTKFSKRSTSRETQLEIRRDVRSAKNTQTQPPTVVGKMEAQSEYYIDIAYTFLHVWYRFVCLLTKFLHRS